MRLFNKVLISTIIFSAFGFFTLAKDLPSDITFPIVELGNCQNRADCEVYCDESENARICLDYAEVHNILSREEIETARKMLDIIESGEGPGGCETEQECDLYCDETNHIEECIIFAKKHNLIPPGELREVDLVLEAIKKGAVPPKCRGKKECDEYCSQPEHVEECVNFALAAGFMKPEEAEIVRKTGGKGPGGCRGKGECDAFCNNLDNMEECINFGLQYGLMPPEEEAKARMALKALEKGFKPLPCRGDEECEIYCSQPEHMKECVDFAEAAGFMSAEDVAKARKMAELGIVGGPGGCKGEEECKVFCQDPANMETCIDFSVKVGDMSQEEANKIIRRMRAIAEGGPGGCKTNEECNAVCQNPATPALAEECINFAVKLGDMAPGEAQQILENMRRMQEGPAPSFVPEGRPEEGVMPAEEMMQPPSPEEIQEMQQQGMEQIQGEIQEQMQEMTPPENMQSPEENP